MKATLIIAFFLFLTSLSFTQTDSLENRNLKKAGETVLAKGDSLLNKIKTRIEQGFLVMTSDNKLGKTDMLNLEDGVDCFEETRQKLNERLHMYSLATTVTLDSSYRTMVNVYFRYGKENTDEKYSIGGSSYTDNKTETIRKTAVSIIGHDVSISWGLPKDTLFVILCYAIIPIFLGLYVGYLIDEKTTLSTGYAILHGIAAAIVAIAFFAIVIV